MYFARMFTSGGPLVPETLSVFLNAFLLEFLQNSGVYEALLT